MAQLKSLYPTQADTFINHGSRDGIGLDIDWQKSDELSSEELDLITDAIRQLEKQGMGYLDRIQDNDADTKIQTQETLGEDILRFDTNGSERMVILANGKIGMGTPTVPHDAEGYALLALDGLQANANGPHIQVTTDQDKYPVLQFLNWQHDSITMYLDAYYDGGEKSSDPGSNFAIQKFNDLLRFQYDTGNAQGAAVGWNDGITLNTSGEVLIPGTLKVDGKGVMEGDATAGRVLRKITLKIEDGTNASTIKCTVIDEWNGDTIAVTDNIVKNATTGNFTLNLAGTVLTVENAGLSGNVLASIVNIQINNTGSDLVCEGSASGNDIRAIFRSGGITQDLTVLADSGVIYLGVLYITDA